MSQLPILGVNTNLYTVVHVTTQHCHTFKQNTKLIKLVGDCFTRKLKSFIANRKSYAKTSREFL